jgi:hypothetical protein
MGKNKNKGGMPNNQSQPQGNQGQAKAGIKAQINQLIKDKKFAIHNKERIQNKNMFAEAKNPGQV